MPEDYEKPTDQDWKWVALSKLVSRTEFALIYKPVINESFTGVGSMTRSDGVYEGEFLDGKFHGKGLFLWKDASYYGEWQEGLCWGYGIMSWNSNHKYEGTKHSFAT